MSVERIFPSRDDLAAVVTAGLGRGQRLDSVQRLRGGSKKGVYRLGLEERRLAFYELALYLSLVAGPLRLLDGDYPGRAQMLAIAEYNVGHALACLD